MTTSRIKVLIGAALIGGSMASGASAQPYWGDPWGGPWSEPGWGGDPWSGPGHPYSGFGRTLDRMHERQREMYDHKAAMQAVERMLSGRRSFDRAKAIGLARQIEASAGANLTRLFGPGDWRMSPLSRARIDDMEAFQANADALQQAAGQLADALQRQPNVEDIRAGRAWSPDWGMAGPYRRWGSGGGAVSKDVLDAYNNLQATCYGCHANFRSRRR